MINDSDHIGKCFRHGVRFKPLSQFDRKCPACWHEHSHKVEQKLFEMIEIDFDEWIVKFPCPRGCGNKARVYSRTKASCTNCGSLIYTEIPFIALILLEKLNK